ncbi:MAG: hypothetical protein IKU95_05865 [Clostridia bacterium]|nr:hypothetical protein [Clostridia bacterium]
MVLKGLYDLFPWIGFPLGVLFILFPKAAWIVTGGFYYLPVEPSNFALRSRQVAGVMRILWTIDQFAFGG